jgi:RNA polymerase-binding protein DksA
VARAAKKSAKLSRKPAPKRAASKGSSGKTSAKKSAKKAPAKVVGKPAKAEAKPAKKPAAGTARTPKRTVATKKRTPTSAARSAREAITTAPAPAPEHQPAEAPQPKAPPPEAVKPAPPKKPRKPEVTRKTIEKIKEQLTAQRVELLREFTDLEEGAFSLSQSDMSGEASFDEEYADAGSFTFEREKELSIGNNIRDLLEKVGHALDRIERGTYGLCENCGDPINKDRLLALPYSSLCIRCKQREERTR